MYCFGSISKHCFLLLIYARYLFFHVDNYSLKGWFDWGGKAAAGQERKSYAATERANLNSKNQAAGA
jgi:hypothetical protein